MSSHEYEKIKARLPWVKDWDPRRPSYMGDPKHSEELRQPVEPKCRAIRVRDDLDAILKAHFTVSSEDVHVTYIRHRQYHRWYLKEGVVVYFVCNLSKGLVISIGSSEKNYGLGTIVEGVKAIIEKNRLRGLQKGLG